MQEPGSWNLEAGNPDAGSRELAARGAPLRHRMMCVVFLASLLSRSAARDVTPSVSAQLALVLLTAIAMGVIDAAMVVFGIAGAAGAFQYVPSRLWVVAPVIWAVLGIVLSAGALLCSRRRAGEWTAAALVLTFLAVRLRSHIALLVVSLVVFAAMMVVLSRWTGPWLARPRRSIAVGVSAALAGCGIVAATPSMTSSTPNNAQAKATDPNVVVIFLDTVRYDAVFDAEGEVHGDLPTFARLRRESTVFTRAYAPSPWTLPSHLSAMTGLPVHELGVSFDSQVYHRSEQTLAERFRQRGYRTAAVISNSFLNEGSGFARGFDVFQQAQAALDICRTAPGLMAETFVPWFAAAVCNWTGSEVTRRARALMTDDERPFFLALNYMDAHDPYYVEGACGGPSGYRQAVRCLDRHLAPIVEWRSARRPTVVAVVGDHGEQFGEHGLVRHGNSLYVQVLHVPLMVRPAYTAEARTSTRPLSIAALGTLLDDAKGSVADDPVLALLHPPAAANLPSEWSAMDASWHLIVREGGAEALYHLATDPAEERNVIAANASDPAVARLRTAIQAMRRAPEPDLRRFRSIGYLH